MAKEKGDRIIDAFKKGEIPFESTEIETRMTDEGKVSNTVTKKCHPCVNEMHDECEQVMCNCDHTYHQRDTPKQ
jgi:hypothetical protein